MTTRRNAHGIPWIAGDSLTAVAREQGRAMAEDRAWQLEVERRRGAGTLAALLGEAAVGWDAFARRADLVATARGAYDGLAPETRAFVDAYVDGVNGAFAAGVLPPECDELGVRPEPWQPWTPLLAFWVQHVLFGSFPNKLWLREVRRAAGPGAVDLLRREGLLAGSNAFAVGGARTASGMPLVAGDPHRILEEPNVYAQVRLTCTDPVDRFDVVGFAFPGVPGIQHFGHAGEVAWAITNAAADTHDVYVESPAAVTERRTERIVVRDADAVEVEVLRTERGPVVLTGPEMLALRTPPEVLGDLGFDAFPALLRARSVADVEAGFARWVEPVNNVVAADRAGRVVHFVAGRVPDRDVALRAGAGAGEEGHGWRGWVDPLPHREVPADGAAITANQRASADYAVLADDFAPPLRADRIGALLDGDAHTPESAAAVLTDVRQNAADRLLEVIAAATDLPAGAAAVRERLLAWDREMTAESTDAGLYVAVRDAVVAGLCAAPGLAPLAGPCPYGDLFAPWFSLPLRMATALPTVLAVEQPFGLRADEVVREALVAVAEEGAHVTWGERHRFRPVRDLTPRGLTEPDTPLAGDSDCVMATASVPGSDQCSRASVARYVWCLADRDGSRWVVPSGASGVPSSAHHRDQHQLWAAGRMLPVRWPEPTEGDS